MANEFDVEWEVDDGYFGGNRPQTTNVDDGILDDEMTDAELKDLYDDIIMEEFMQNITAYGNNRTEFVEWAKTAMKAFKEEDNE